MRRVRLSQLNGNELLARDIFDDTGRILLSNGTKMYRKYIRLLEEREIYSVFIEDELSKGVVVEDFISDETRQEAKNVVKNTFEKFLDSNETNVDNIKTSVGNIMEEIMSQKGLMIASSEIRSASEWLFSHSVNVCALSVIVGNKMGYNALKLNDLAVGAMLHDIGSIVLPKEIIKNPDSLNEEHNKIFKRHVLEGYKKLKDNVEVTAYAKVIALMHHEHCDGSGYPMGYTKEKLHEFVKIVTVCDAFDIMTSRRGKYKDMHVYKVVEYLVAMSDKLFDKDVVKVFTDNVTVYPNGDAIKLNNGEKGIVLSQNKGLPTRPKVRILFKDEYNDRTAYKNIDLAKEPTLFIVDACYI